jgi:hypothetical protein
MNLPVFLTLFFGLLGFLESSSGLPHPASKINAPHKIKRVAELGLGGLVSVDAKEVIPSIIGRQQGNGIVERQPIPKNSESKSPM